MCCPFGARRMVGCLLLLSITCILPSLSEPEDHLEPVDKKSLQLGLGLVPSVDGWRHLLVNPELFLLRLRSDPPASSQKKGTNCVIFILIGNFQPTKSKKPGKRQMKFSTFSHAARLKVLEGHLFHPQISVPRQEKT